MRRFMWRRRIFRVFLWFSVVAVILNVGLALMIWNFGGSDYANRADCVIVLGAAVSGMEPSLVFRERIRHGVSLVRSQLAYQIIFTGGVGKGDEFSEGGVGAVHAMKGGFQRGRYTLRKVRGLRLKT